MGKKSFSRNCLQGKTLPVSRRPYFRKIKRIPENVIASILPRVLSSLSARARPRKWRERVSARSLYYVVYRLLFTQKGLSHFEYDTLYSLANIAQVERFSKRLEKSPSNDSISAFPLFFIMSCECEDRPRIGHLIA